MLITRPTCVSSRTGKPLLAHSSETKAQREALRAKLKYNSDLEPYHCSDCQLWHLKPAQWPECGYCRGRDGGRKISYPSIEVAEEKAARLSECSYVRLRAYECFHERAWHLTHT
jgi:hypothetical protein